MGLMQSQNGRSNCDWDIATLNAVTTNGQSPDYENKYGWAIHVNINVTAITGTTPTLTISLNGRDAKSGQQYTIATHTTAITATGLYRLVVNPGSVPGSSSSTPPGAPPANVIGWSADFLPHLFNVSWAIGGTTPAVTATIGASVNVQQGA